MKKILSIVLLAAVILVAPRSAMAGSCTTVNGVQYCTLTAPPPPVPQLPAQPSLLDYIAAAIVALGGPYVPPPVCTSSSPCNAT